MHSTTSPSIVFNITTQYSVLSTQYSVLSTSTQKYSMPHQYIGRDAASQSAITSIGSMNAIFMVQRRQIKEEKREVGQNSFGSAGSLLEARVSLTGRVHAWLSTALRSPLLRDQPERTCRGRRRKRRHSRAPTHRPYFTVPA